MNEDVSIASTGRSRKTHANSDNVKNIPDQPALFITTQTTIPQLTALMFAFSLALLTFAASTEWPAATILNDITTRSIAIALLGFSAMSFIFATTACVKSHAWDYWALSKDQRTDERLSDNDSYKNRCRKRSRSWHRVAVWSYNTGFIVVMISMSFLFWPLSQITSITVTIGLGLIIAFKIFVMLMPDLAEQIAEHIQKES